jgi:hypothetical protein
MPSSLRTPLICIAVLAALVPMLAHAPRAQASDQQLSIMMDDDNLIYRGDEVRDQTLRQMKAMGVDYVRVTLLWSVVADGAQSTPARKRHFYKRGANNPKAYPRLNWDRYDQLVRACKTLGIGVYFDITGPGPAWGMTKPPRSQARNRRTWKPKPRQFYKFVQAVGTRYNGTYHDENYGHGALPRVSFWSLWNEPNQGGWLTPQWWKGQPYAPRLYRDLYFFGHRALESTGHAKDVILIGETAPIGSDARTTRSPIRPKPFINALLCIGTTDPGCSDFDKYGPLQATAWAHHPYTKKLAPNQRDPNPDDITMANIADLPALLDNAAATTNHIVSGLNVVSSEFGYETNPPDPYQGIPLETQANWINLGDLLAWQQPRVMANTQFLLRDVPPLRNHKVGSKAYWFTYQSGLFTQNGQAKPAAQAYSFPFLAFVTGRNPDSGAPIVTYWGQLRFRPNDLPPEAYDTVQLQFKPADGSTDWVPLGDPVVVSNGKGFFTGQIEVPAAGSVRAHWEGAQVPYTADSRAFPVA